MILFVFNFVLLRENDFCSFHPIRRFSKTDCESRCAVRSMQCGCHTNVTSRKKRKPLRHPEFLIKRGWVRPFRASGRRRCIVWPLTISRHAALLADGPEARLLPAVGNKFVGPADTADAARRIRGEPPMPFAARLARGKMPPTIRASKTNRGTALMYAAKAVLSQGQPCPA